jgi:hypothetical protein
LEDRWTGIEVEGSLDMVVISTQGISGCAPRHVIRDFDTGSCLACAVRENRSRLRKLLLDARFSPSAETALGKRHIRI